MAIRCESCGHVVLVLRVNSRGQEVCAVCLMRDLREEGGEG